MIKNETTLEEDFYEKLILFYGQFSFEIPNNVDDSEVCLERSNPLCGDHVELGWIRQGSCLHLWAVAKGCLLCRASSAIMLESLEKHHHQEWYMQCQIVMKNFQSPVPTAEVLETQSMGALYWLKRYPVRTKCAILPWQTLIDAWEKFQNGYE